MDEHMLEMEANPLTDNKFCSAFISPFHHYQARVRNDIPPQHGQSSKRTHAENERQAEEEAKRMQ